MHSTREYRHFTDGVCSPICKGGIVVFLRGMSLQCAYPQVSQRRPKKPSAGRKRILKIDEYPKLLVLSVSVSIG